MKLLVTQWYLTLCNPMDCSPSGSSVRGILQARILEWVAIPFSRVSSWPRDWTWVFCIVGRFFTFWATREAPLGNSKLTNNVVIVSSESEGTQQYIYVYPFSSQRKAMPTSVQTTTQLYSFHMQAKSHSKFSKLGFNSTWTENIQMFKLDLEKAEESEVK